MVRVAAAQMRVSEHMEENYQKSLRLIREASEAGAQMVCFPEGQLTHYIPQYQGLKSESFAIGLDHPYVRGFRDACRENRILASVALNLDMDGKVYPSMMLIDEQGEVLGVTKKNHIVYAPHFYEQDYFAPGGGGFPVFETSIGRVAQIVCFDRHFPESWRTCALKGVDFIVTAVANEKIEPCEVFQWEIRIPAFQNSVHCLMVNRESTNQMIQFGGVQVRPGDIVIGDDTGVVVVPDSVAERVAEIAENIDAKERELLTLVEQGHTLKEARELTGYHHLQTKEA